MNSSSFGIVMAYRKFEPEPSTRTSAASLFQARSGNHVCDGVGEARPGHAQAPTQARTEQSRATGGERTKCGWGHCAAPHLLHLHRVVGRGQRALLLCDSSVSLAWFSEVTLLVFVIVRFQVSCLEHRREQKPRHP